MDFLNQAIAQLRDLFQSMTPAARITAVLLAGVIAVSLGYLTQHRSAGSDQYLFGGEYLPPTDADRAMAAIAQAGLQNAEREGNRIKVPHGQESTYLAAVADGGALPPNFHQLMDDALDSNPLTDGNTRQHRINAAKQQMLSMMLRKMAGIEEAMLMFDISKIGGLSRKRQVTASVSVRAIPGEAIDANRVKMIRKAVAGAIAGLQPGDVTITDLGSGSAFGGGTSDAAAGLLDDRYYQTRIAYERLMKSNIEDLLLNIPGVRVQVTAELDETLGKNTKTIKTDAEGAPLSTTVVENKKTIRRQENGGRVGLIAQGPNPGGVEQTSQALIENETTETTNKANNLVGTREEILTEAGLVPRQVRAAIAVPSDYIVKVWREKQPKNPDGLLNDQFPSDTDLQNTEEAIKTNIENVVAALLPKVPGKTNFPNVHFSVFQSLTPEAIEPPSTTNKALSWASLNFNTLMMGGLGLVSLMMLRSLVKSIPPSEPMEAIESMEPATLPMHAGNVVPSESADTQEGSEKESSGLSKLRMKKGPNIRDELSEIIREDPDAAAAILRSWIGKAS